MRNLAHLTARLFNTPLMLRPEAASSLAGTFLQLMGDGGSTTLVIGAQVRDERQPEPFAFAGNVPISRFKDKPYSVTDEGIALLSITGPLVQRSGQINPDCSPLASYQRLQGRMDAMQADADVKGILLEWDSPGGETFGNFALANRLMQSRGSKPVWSYVNELAASAAYSLAASTDRILMPASGLVGSIGVVMLHMDQSERDKKQGLSYTYIYAGDRKVDMNSHAPLSAEARATADKMVQGAYDQFTAHVATTRGMSQQAVRDTQAAIFNGSEARQIGLADEISSFDEALAELTALVQRGQQFSAPGGRMAAPNSVKGGTMSQANQAATPPAISASQPQGSQASADSRDVGATVTQQQLAQARSEGVSLGQSTERQRIQGILGHAEAQGRQQLASTLAFSTDMTVDQVGAVLASAAKEGQAAPAPKALSPLAAAMANVPNPIITAAAPAASDAEGTPQALAANVVSLFNANQGVKND